MNRASESQRVTVPSRLYFKSLGERKIEAQALISYSRYSQYTYSFSLLIFLRKLLK